jgi:hypothetical protein
MLLLLLCHYPTPGMIMPELKDPFGVDPRGRVSPVWYLDIANDLLSPETSSPIGPFIDYSPGGVATISSRTSPAKPESRDCQTSSLCRQTPYYRPFVRFLTDQKLPANSQTPAADTSTQMPNDTSHYVAPILGPSREQLFALFGNLIAFAILFVWPAIKTFAGIQRKHHRGRWAAYWVGVTVIWPILKILAFIFQRWTLFPFAEVLFAVICTHGNGQLVQQFTKKVLSPILQKYYYKIRDIPAQVPSIIGTAVQTIIRLVWTKGPPSGSHRD